MAINTPARPAVSLAGRIVTQAIAFAVFVVLPVVITLVAPLSTIEFRKSNGASSVTVQRYVLIFVPWRTTHVDNVARLRADITAEKHYRGTVEERRKGQSGTSYSTGQVAILGAGSEPEAIVQAAPDLAKEIVARFERFAAAPDAPPVSIEVYASWSLSYLLGGAVTALCALYVTGAVLAVLTFPFKLLRSRRRSAA
ncbi:MAG: hypothetical protein JNK67_20175 [Alphaproteobacteria bacterium]|nr:hypothetical protein [Alphaproteobacteria bacterium]